MNPRVSVIIPCYNHGKYIREALAGVEKLPRDLYEIIIVNDGSTDAYTIETLEKLQAENYHIIHQENQGLGKTRNNGIKLAKGEFILPLDADNRINPQYIRKAIQLFDQYANISVVYSDPNYFGDKTGSSALPDFNLQKMMIGNYIDACALYRKSAWEDVGGYDENMPYMGIEDWEFWLHLAFKGHQFYHIKEALYDYRVAAVSMIKKDTAPHFQELKKYIEVKHEAFLNYDAIGNYVGERFKAAPFLFLIKLILKTYFPKKYSQLVANKKINRI
ncbi:MAG: glycosyltransferase family 2 protein [Bacteroidia bacterium]